MSRLLDLLYPRRCPVCGEIIPFAKAVCGCTKQQVCRLPAGACEHCGAPQDRCTCEEPTNRTLRHITAPFVYADLIRAQLLSLKLQGEKQLAKPLGAQMALRFAERFPQAEIDVVTFVPMTRAAQRERGYNQGALLAQQVGQLLLLPVAPLLQKGTETEHQRSLNAQQRLENLRGAFSPAPGAQIQGKTVMLCDDIKTTGSTLWECETTLMAAGAADVFCLCCAVTAYDVGNPLL